jgi:anti-sigma factor RsiW
MSRRSQDELLMRYYDGELSEQEAAELERTLDATGARVVAGLDQLGAILRSAGEQRGEAAGDIAGAVLERIEREEAPAPAPTPLAKPAPRWVAPAAVAVLAAAASLALFAGSGLESPAPVASRAPLPAEPSHPVAVPAPPVPEPALEEEEDVAPAVAIEAVDFGSYNGAIFMVSAGAEATPVVWLTDDTPRTEPL